MPKPFEPIAFHATLHRPAEPADADWFFLSLPMEASARLPSRGLASVDGRFAGVPFAATLQPDGQGGHWLRVERALRDAAGVDVGDRVALEIAPASREPEPRVPSDLADALAVATAARVQWSKLTPVARRDFIQWLETAKKAETRTRRIATACDMLAAGKRRICCFDRSGVYGKGMSAPTPAD